MSKFFNRIFPRPEFLAEPPYRKRKLITDISIFLLAFFVCSIVVNIIVTPVVFIDLISRGLLDSIIQNGLSINSLYDTLDILIGKMSEWVTIVSLISFGILTGGTILLRKGIEHGSVKSLGFTKRNFFPPYFLGFAIGLGLISIVILVQVLTGSALFVGFHNFDSEHIGKNITYLVLYLIGFAIQGMAEEVMFRGYLMTAITRKHSTTLAVIVSSFIFMIFHIPNPGMDMLSLSVIFMMGVLCCVLTLKTGNIFVSCGLHTAWNFAVTCIYTDSEVESNASVFKLLFTGKTFGINEYWLCLAVMVIAFVVFAIIKFPGVKYLTPAGKTEVADPIVSPLPTTEEQITNEAITEETTNAEETEVTDDSEGPVTETEVPVDETVPETVAAAAVEEPVKETSADEPSEYASEPECATDNEKQE